MPGHLNGHGGSNSPGNDNDNIVIMPTLAERDRLRREKEKAVQKTVNTSEPLINMPPVTKSLIGLLLAVHILVAVILPPETADTIIGRFGFTPAKFSGGIPDLYTLASPLTHMLLHGGWTHIVMNLLMLAAFGSGVERWLGSKHMLVLLAVSGLSGAAFHYLLNTGSAFPMIGASGGISGLFAAAIMMLARGQREMGGRFGILPFALLWIGLSIGFGMLGGPDGSMIAWAAHVGGFIGGLAVLKIMRI